VHGRVWEKNGSCLPAIQLGVVQALSQVAAKDEQDGRRNGA